MSFRLRLLIALAAAALIPLAGFAVGLRARVTERLTGEYERRVASVAGAIEAELTRRDAFIRDRLATLTSALANDNRFRLAAVGGAGSERPYLLDYAERAMRLTGLSMLQIQDERGRIISSGHFRNEYDRLEPELPRRVSTVPGGLALVRARAPEGSFLALVRTDSLRVGGRRFTIVGGQAIGEHDLDGMAGGRELTVSLTTPDTTLSSGGAAARSGDVSANVAPAASRVVREI